MSVVPIIVDHYTVPLNRPVKKKRFHGQGLLITLLGSMENIRLKTKTDKEKLYNKETCITLCFLKDRVCPKPGLYSKLLSKNR